MEEQNNNGGMKLKTEKNRIKNDSGKKRWKKDGRLE